MDFGPNLAATTRKNYLTYLKHFIEWLTESSSYSKEDVGQVVSISDVQKYIDDNGFGTAANCNTRKRAVVKSLDLWGISHDTLKWNRKKGVGQNSSGRFVGKTYDHTAYPKEIVAKIIENLYKSEDTE